VSTACDGSAAEFRHGYDPLKLLCELTLMFNQSLMQ
jgi:hypothetical protein